MEWRLKIDRNKINLSIRLIYLLKAVSNSNKITQFIYSKSLNSLDNQRSDLAEIPTTDPKCSEVYI